MKLPEFNARNETYDRERVWRRSPEEGEIPVSLILLRLSHFPFFLFMQYRSGQKADKCNFDVTLTFFYHNINLLSTKRHFLTNSRSEHDLEKFVKSSATRGLETSTRVQFQHCITD